MVHTPDGCKLHVLVCSQQKQQGQYHGVVVCGHAFMVHHGTLLRHDRPSVAATLAQRGFLVLCLDIRGRRKSRHEAHPRHVDRSPPSREHHFSVADQSICSYSSPPLYSYDNCVADVELMVLLGRRLMQDREAPVFLLGHSMFSHQSLAYCGIAAMRLEEALQGVELLSTEFVVLLPMSHAPKRCRCCRVCSGACG